MEESLESEKRGGGNLTTARRILLATDGSLPSLAATLHAIELVRDSGAELHAVHVTTPESDLQVEFADTSLELLHVRPVDGLEAARYLAAKAGIGLHAHESHGPIVDSIIAVAERLGADAIVLGETGTRPYPQIGPRSVATAVRDRCSRTPVILVAGRSEEVVPVVREILAHDPAAVPGGASLDPNLDWTEATRDPSFRALMSAKTRFLVPVVAIYLGFYLGVALLAGFAREFMAQSVIGALNVGYLLILAIYAMAWIIALIYVRVANRSFDPKAEQALTALHERERR